MTVVADNLKRIRESIDGRHPQGHAVTVVGVTKKQPPELIRQGIEAGLTVLGNNYVQDGETLRAGLSAAGADAPVEWHFIGHIQSRKAKQLGDYHGVQSLDRLDIARDLSARAVAAGRKLSVLVEVNIAAEAQKSGVAPERLPDFLTEAGALPGLTLAGLMCLPPPLDPPTLRIPHFERMARLYAEGAQKYPFRHLSMGTSDDYVIAVQCGANMVRLGTLLFGSRS